jgi:hypothetical protein
MTQDEELFYSHPYLFDPQPNLYHDPLRQRSFGDRRDFHHNVWQIRRALGSEIDSNVLIEFHCYNEYEKDETAKLLSEAERKHVRLFWLTFGGTGAGTPGKPVKQSEGQK